MDDGNSTKPCMCFQSFCHLDWCTEHYIYPDSCSKFRIEVKSSDCHDRDVSRSSEQQEMQACKKVSQNKYFYF